MIMLVYRFTKFHCKILGMMHRMGKFTPTHTRTNIHTYVLQGIIHFVVIWLLGYNVIWSKLYRKFHFSI